MLKNKTEENSSQQKNLSGTSFTHVLHVPRCPQSDIFHPKCPHGKLVRGSTQATTRTRKGKGPKCTTHFRCPIKNCSPYWSETMGFLSSPQDQWDLHIRKDTILMPDVSITGELEGIPQRIARLSRTRSNLWSMRIRPNSENLLMVIRSIKIKDQLGAVFSPFCLWMFAFVNVLFEKCKLCFDVSICMKWINLFQTPFVIMNFADISEKGNKFHDHKVNTQKWKWKCFSNVWFWSWKNWWLLLVINSSRWTLPFTLEPFEKTSCPEG